MVRDIDDPPPAGSFDGRADHPDLDTDQAGEDGPVDTRERDLCIAGKDQAGCLDQHRWNGPDQDSQPAADNTQSAHDLPPILPVRRLRQEPGVQVGLWQNPGTPIQGGRSLILAEVGFFAHNDLDNPHMRRNNGATMTVRRNPQRLFVR